MVAPTFLKIMEEYVRDKDKFTLSSSDGIIYLDRGDEYRPHFIDLHLLFSELLEDLDQISTVLEETRTVRECKEEIRDLEEELNYNEIKYAELQKRYDDLDEKLQNIENEKDTR